MRSDRPRRPWGYERLENTPVQQFMEDAMSETMAGSRATSFTYVYGTREG
ncbi:hypothetical protein ACWCRF_38070 [Streptomyces sp. NPDC002405]